MSFLAVFTSGITVVVSRTTNAKLGKVIGNIKSTFYNYLTGLIVSILILFLSQEQMGSILPPKKVTDYVMYLGGIIGVVAIMLSNYVTPRISSFQLTIILFISQLFTGILIDWISYETFSLGKVIGGLLAILGLTYNTWIDYRVESTPPTT
ncbi:MAG TPA: DMT family transporter [Lachnospiraceae bacterium]|nr:DMT family transporter [Lachnospiraceae bacterium]